ncbi:hypothetical protein BC830DRAFT_767055 [Chytriomyces sp. MP71]|nr:hypothetical protein BC830DRAFT_767055 [Chytriomyces sp. MP71]
MEKNMKSAASPTPSAATVKPAALSVSEKLAKGKALKEQGNAEYRAAGSDEERIRAAMRHYYSSLVACYNNLAACSARLARWDRVVANADQVLKRAPGNAKALFRRGQAHLALNDLAKAERDLTQAAALAPADVGIKAELAKLRKREKEYETKQKKEWAGLFDRM